MRNVGGSAFLLFQQFFHIPRQHKSTTVQVGGVVPGFDVPRIPAGSVKILQRVVLFGGKPEQPVARRAGGNVRLVHPLMGKLR